MQQRDKSLAHVTSPQRVVDGETARKSRPMALGRPPMKSEIALAEEDGKGTGIPTEDLGDWPKFPDSEARLNRLPLKYLRDIIVDACVAGKPPTEAGIQAASQRHAVEMQDQSACCGCVF